MDILDLVKSHPILAGVTIFAGTFLASELIWKAIKYVRTKTRRRRIHEVLFFNELGEICYKNHAKGPKSATKTFECGNKHCSSTQLDKIVKLIDEAQYSIDIAVYTFTSTVLFSAVERALQRGVFIRMISDHVMLYSTHSKVLQLAAFDVPVRGPSKTTMMHHKFCVIDGVARVQEILKRKENKWPLPYESVVINGSVNWTSSGFVGNIENCIISSDAFLAYTFQEEFSRMWRAFSVEEFLKK